MTDENKNPADMGTTEHIISHMSPETQRPDDPNPQKKINMTNDLNENIHPKEIFIVLSERDDFNNDCLNTLKSYAIKPIILNNRDEIRSIAEMLNQFLSVRFALILLAGDDFIYDRLKGKPGEAVLGAKQHTVFLLGYLVATFGPMGTLVMYRDQKSFRLPTGFQHTAFIPYQQGGGWKQILESKLKTQNIL